MVKQEKDIVIKFFELKAKQLICKLWLALNQKPGYVGIEGAGEMFEVLKVQGKLDDVEKELIEMLKANEQFLRDANLEELATHSEFKVSLEKQKEFAKELLGYETTIEDLFEKYYK